MLSPINCRSFQPSLLDTLDEFSELATKSLLTFFQTGKNITIVQLFRFSCQFVVVTRDSAF